MAKGENQKLKLLYLRQIFLTETDDEHGLTMEELISRLSKMGVNADRKTIYLDIEELRRFGMDIIGEKVAKSFIYRLVNRDYELAELKLLVDAVVSSKFITEKKSHALIKKLEMLVSKHQSNQLNRHVYMSGRIKAMNESIYYNVDSIYTAIGKNRKIRFQYCRWNLKKESELRREGAYYCASPWGLLWDDENYYMIAYEDESETLKHYRVDKMKNISCIDDERCGADIFSEAAVPNYSVGLFNMFGGERVSVRLRVNKNLVGTIIDRFGKDIPIVADCDESFITSVEVAASRQFLGWLIALGDDVTVLSPDSIIEALAEEGQRLAQKYLNRD